jgi:hypothetical protein
VGQGLLAESYQIDALPAVPRAHLAVGRPELGGQPSR